LPFILKDILSEWVEEKNREEMPNPGSPGKRLMKSVDIFITV